MNVQEQRLILIVEDDEATRTFLARQPRRRRLSGCGRAQRGRGPAGDRGTPAGVWWCSTSCSTDSSGLALLDRLRASDGLVSRLDPDLPVIVLSGRAGDADRVRSFSRGADDHLNKPFLYAELLARVRALLRRAEGRRARGVLRAGELTIDPATRAVRLAGRRIELSAKEFALLHALAEDPARVYGKQELLRDVWGYLAPGRTRTLDAHACRLRKKLSPSPRRWIVNVRGVGYRLTEAL